MNEFVLDGFHFVDVFVIVGWFEVYEEFVERLFCLPMFDIDYVPHIMLYIVEFILMLSRSVVWWRCLITTL